MKRAAASTKRTGQPRCMQRVEIAMYWLYLSGLSVSIFGSRLRIYVVVLPACPMPGTIVMTFGT